MAHKKGGASSRNGRDTVGKRRGVKLFGGQLTQPGAIIVRQCGTKFHPGENVGMGRDYTLFSLIDGAVSFGYKGTRHYVNVTPVESSEVA